MIGNIQFQLTLVTGLRSGLKGPAGLQNADTAVLLKVNMVNMHSSTILTTYI